MNKRGQALVEFVLILPVFLFLILAIYDFGMISSHQNKLENDSVDMILLYKNGLSIDEIESKYKNVNIKVTNVDNYDIFLINSKVKLVTPGFNLIFGNPYVISVERYIPNE